MPMEIALKEAQKAFSRDEVPVGAVITDEKGDIIAANSNRIIELNDPTAHAEILVIRQAAEKLNTPRLTDCNLYVTLEPCPMCAQAISFARIKNLYFGAEDKKGGGVFNGPKIFQSSSCHHSPEIYEGFLSGKSADLLKNFFKAKRG